MTGKKILGITMILFAIIITALSIKSTFSKKEETTVQSTSETTAENLTMEITTQSEAVTQLATESEIENTIEDVTINVRDEEHFNENQFDIRFPAEDTMNLIDNDIEGLKREIMTFINGYGYGDAEYADYTGDMEINSNENQITLTYYLKYERSETIYFYLFYNKNTKQWSSKQEGSRIWRR